MSKDDKKYTIVDYQDGEIEITLISIPKQYGFPIYEIKKTKGDRVLMHGWTQTLREAIEIVNHLIDSMCLEN